MIHRAPVLLLAALTTTLVWPAIAPRAEPTLAPFHAEYKIRISIVRGESVLTLNRLAENEYLLTARATPKGFLGLFVRGGIDETSHFSLNDGRVLPLRYERTDTISKEERDVSLTFDWTAGTVVRRHDDIVEELPIPPNAVDPALLPIVVMVDRLHGRAPGPYTLIERGHTETLDITDKGSETVKTRAGTFEAQHYSNDSDESGRVTSLWASPDLGHLMVRMAQFKGGKERARLELTSYSIDAKPSPPDSP